jgi:hypothetical protein
MNHKLVCPENLPPENELENLGTLALHWEPPRFVVPVFERYVVNTFLALA